MFNRKLFFLWLLTIVGSVQCAAAIRTIVVCALGQPQLSASFIVNDGVECEDTCASQGNLYSLYQPSTASCACNNVGYPIPFLQTNRVNSVCDPRQAHLVITTRLVGTFSYLGCGTGGGTFVGPSKSVGGSFENIFSTCKDYKYVAITTTSNYPAALCFTQYTGTPVTTCPGSIFQIYGHTPGATISGYSRKKRQIEEEERQMQQDTESMEWEALDEQLRFEQNKPVAEVSIEEIEAQFRVMSAQASCPVGLTACAVPSLDGTDSGFECLEVETELESCGGCLHGLYQGENVHSALNGTDCSALPNIALGGVTCQAGQCHISACDDGFNLVDDQCV